jgi:hypothetical protein
MTSVAPPSPSPLANISYEDLYSRWERGNWRATELDFTRDREQWENDFSEFERRAALWNYALFFWGEDAVADGLSPYIDAAPLEEQKYFLATQQVDEARHAVFFKRFMTEVAGIGGSMNDALDAIRPQLTWGFVQVFDRLERMSEELRQDRSIPRLAQAMVLYHVIIEATLAQPGQHFITSYLDRREVLPAFREGMHNIAADEQRHIGFGVKMLSDLRDMDPVEVPPAVADLLREVIPWTAAVLVPPGWDTRYVECFGSTLEEIGYEGVTSFETKMRTAGLPLDELPGPPVFVPGIPPEERVRLGQTLVKNRVFGEKLGPPERDAETMQALFRFVSQGLDTSKAPGPGVLQWDFTDADPWYVSVDNGSSAAAQGRADSPTITFRSRYEDFVDIIAGRADPKRMLLRGRYRARGNLRWLWRAREMFPA